MSKNSERRAQQAAQQLLDRDNAAAAPTGTAPAKKQYSGKAVALVISKARAGIHADLVKLANRLNCRLSDLIWSGISAVLANPPTVAPAGTAPRVGTAAGIWLVHERDGETKQLTGIKLLDVSTRAQASGRLFFRYDREDPKARERAIRSAQRSAAYDAEMAGLDCSAGFSVVKMKA